MSTNACGSLARKLAAISREIGKVPKSGHNSFHKYDYVTENDLVYAVREKLAAAEIFVFTATESQAVQVINHEGKQSILTQVCTKHTFVDGETGEQFSVLSQGQGSDVGDKGGYKAITGAMKYFIYKCFMIPTGDDPEADPDTDRRHGAQPQQGTQARTPPAKPTSPPPEERTRGDWRSFIVPKFIPKYGGTKLGNMAETDLAYWCSKYEPKPFKGVINPADEDFRAALDDASYDMQQSGR